jgi:hypothetical protein
MDDDENTLRDSEVALMDAIKTLCEVFIAKKITTPEALGELFARQSASYPEAMPKAVFVMDSLRAFALDPARKEARRALERFLQEPPAGSA